MGLALRSSRAWFAASAPNRLSLGWAGSTQVLDVMWKQIALLMIGLLCGCSATKWRHAASDLYLHDGLLFCWSKSEIYSLTQCDAHIEASNQVKTCISSVTRKQPFPGAITAQQQIRACMSNAGWKLVPIPYPVDVIKSKRISKCTTDMGAEHCKYEDG